MRIAVSWLVAALLALLLAGPVHAQPLVPTAQTRSVSGSASATDSSGTVNDSDSDSAPDFAPFASAASADATLPDAIGTGGGQQDSAILADAITASGSAFATAESFIEDSQASGSGQSLVDVEFTLSERSNYSIQGFIEAFDSGSSSLTLSDSGGPIFTADAAGGRTDLDESGTLPAGDYRLVIVASGGAFADFFFSEFAFAEYDVAFQLTPPTVPAVGGWGLLATALGLAAAAAAVSRRRGRDA